jgi:hypothetical protein
MPRTDNEYAMWLRSDNKNQLFRELKPRERICKIIVTRILPKVESLGFKFVKSRMQLERKVGDFKQIVFFRTSRNNYRDEVVNFEIEIKVENDEYSSVCSEKFKYHNTMLCYKLVRYFDLWKQDYLFGWYKLHKDDNLKIAEAIADNIIHCTEQYFVPNSEFNSSLAYKYGKFKSLSYFALLEIPEMLILSDITKNSDTQEKIIEDYAQWKVTEKGIKSLEEGADIFGEIEGIINLLQHQPSK